MINQISTVADQAQSLRSLSPAKPISNFKDAGNLKTKVFAITSGKGGVGKTVIGVNTALSLAKLGKSVLLFDADLGLANIDVYLGLAPPFNLNHFFAGEKVLVDVLLDGPLGIKILPAGSGIQNFTSLDTHQKRKLFDGFRTMDVNFDFILIDTETGISKNTTHFASAADDILVITTPDPVAITDAYALMKLLSTEYQKKHFSLVVNRINSEEEALDAYHKLTMVANKHLNISIKYIGSLPEDKQMIESIKVKKAIVELYPSSNIACAFTKLANFLCFEKTQNERIEKYQPFWKNVFNFGKKE